MSAVAAYLPWALFGVMVLFGAVFALVAVLQARKAGKAQDDAEAARMQLAQVEARARAAEARIQEAEQRANMAEQRITHAEERVEKAREAAKAAEARAEDAERRAGEAQQAAQRADSALQQRRDEAEEKARKAQLRARSLIDWARQQWEARREPDRQKAQGQQGSFQAQLEAFLEYRKKPITFRIDSEIDRMAGPLIERYAGEQEHVQVQGDLVRVTFPVDASKGFRA
ncbi:MAG TPA: hypothetical protein RMH99_25260 [Sandaracinaceae bacterium LLY-WYZ-13_1]|nr:hypothetical protein [Sandaracinaceae bacterium LLY-WYZ-13_1]